MSTSVTAEVVQPPPTVEQAMQLFMNADVGALKKRSLVVGATSGATLIYGLLTNKSVARWLGALGLVEAVLEYKAMQAKSAILTQLNDARFAASNAAGYAVGRSQLTPDELAQVKAGNAALNGW